MPKKLSTTERLDTAKRLLIEVYLEYRQQDATDPILDDLTEAIHATTWSMVATLAPDAKARKAIDKNDRPHRHDPPAAARDTIVNIVKPALKQA